VTTLPQGDRDDKTRTEAIGMARIPHDLPEEFPQETKFIARWIEIDPEFGRLAASYDEVNREIHRLESEERLAPDEMLEELKKQRLKLKDEISAFISKMERRM
jgi:uncharacterized protein YdcH (DUF465 family)